MSAFTSRQLSYKRLFLLYLSTAALLPNLAQAGLFDWLSASDKAQTNQSDFLTAEQAFRLSSNQTADALTLSFEIAPGYYLYRHQLSVTPEQAEFGDWQLPQGQPHEDAYFGKSQVYTESFALPLPLLKVDEQAHVIVKYQGCTTDLCYAPQTVHIPLTASH